MEPRCQEVIDACCALGDDTPISLLHDVGAGGMSNALPELVHDANAGGAFELRNIPNADPGMSPLEIWCNEAQERYVTRLRSYEENRETWPLVLEAQEDFFRRRLTYVDHLVAWQETKIIIDGLLLVDGLTPPAGVPVPGHIDAVPKPR